MKKHLKTIALIILFIAIAGYFYFSYFMLGQKKVQQKEEVIENIVPVRTVLAKLGDIHTEILLSGNVEADSKVTIFSKASGRLEKLLVTIGDVVEKNTSKIAVIDHANLEAQVKVAQAQLESINVNLNNLSKEKERMGKLYQDGSISQQTWEKTETAYLDLQAKKKLAESTLNLTEIQLAEATLWATISGIISQKYVDEGDMISPNTRVADIINIDRVKIKVGLPEIYLTRVLKGTPLKIQVDTYPGKLFTGEISQIYPEIDQRTLTAEAEIIIPNPEHILKPGMFARVQFMPELNKNSLLVPAQAVVNGKTGKIVFTFDKNFTAVSRLVKTGLATATQIEIIEGLKQDEEVIVEGNIGLKENTRVKIEEREN